MGNSGSTKGLFWYIKGQSGANKGVTGGKLGVVGLLVVRPSVTGGARECRCIRVRRGRTPRQRTPCVCECGAFREMVATTLRARQRSLRWISSAICQRVDALKREWSTESGCASQATIGFACVVTTLRELSIYKSTSNLSQKILTHHKQGEIARVQY